MNTYITGVFYVIFSLISCYDIRYPMLNIVNGYCLTITNVVIVIPCHNGYIVFSYSLCKVTSVYYTANPVALVCVSKHEWVFSENKSKKRVILIFSF